MNNIHVFLLSTAFLALFSCRAELLPTLPEEAGNYPITTTQQLQDPGYCQKIEDLYASGLEGSFKGKADVPIYYRIFKHPEPEKGAILISTGRTEATLKYKEVIFDLYNNGYSVYIHDHRGQGLSGRMAGDPEMAYIDTFQFYVDDMKHFYDKFLSINDHQKVYLLAHSMGGAIGMTYLEQYPDDFDAAVFSSPMLGLSPPICLLAKILKGKEPKFAPGQSGYEDDSASFHDNSVTGSEIRYHRMIAAYDRVPQARLGGASTLWVYRSCKHFKYMFDHIEDIETPFLLFSAENETVVDPDAHVEFTENAGMLNKEYEAYLVEDAQHEVLMEKDRQRTAVMNAALEFFEGY